LRTLHGPGSIQSRNPAPRNMMYCHKSS